MPVPTTPEIRSLAVSGHLKIKFEIGGKGAFKVRLCNNTPFKKAYFMRFNLSVAFSRDFDLENWDEQ